MTIIILIIVVIVISRYICVMYVYVCVVCMTGLRDYRCIDTLVHVICYCYCHSLILSHSFSSENGLSSILSIPGPTISLWPCMVTGQQTCKRKSWIQMNTYACSFAFHSSGFVHKQTHTNYERLQLCINRACGRIFVVIHLIYIFIQTQNMCTMNNFFFSFYIHLHTYFHSQLLSKCWMV